MNGRNAARWFAVILLLTLASPCLAQTQAQPGPQRKAAVTQVNTPVEVPEPSPTPEKAATPTMAADASRTVQQVLMFGAASLIPVALLTITPFVRINIVLILLRQALGSPQVPGNQVLTALSLLLAALVMRPVAEKVYVEAIEPYQAGRVGVAEAWRTGSEPIKTFMVDQIVLTNHQEYLTTLYDRAHPGASFGSKPDAAEDFPIGVVAPAYILSELTTALKIGFMLYLPFLVIDLVVSAVLAAMGLFMLPPTLVSTPAKLIVFVLADGWLLVADMLLASLSA
ncbi:flagellar type III secretion system pore protein FliP [Paludisphaera rhizosphaerae]|uniref:flagellar type III secretion system pore protein FliP n=1 Tax=Paludisphaera rhizosphaerae TaxID=2711216 RepID=UPI0013EC5DAD|nr:flagellar type III secretion system pore protein FliP [Paludisphaera rhizosphaerae]